MHSHLWLPPRLSARCQDDLREIWLFLIGMGMALIVLGIVAVSFSFVATLATVLVFGILILVGAFFQIVTSFWGRHWSGAVLHLVSGILYLVVGVFMIDDPPRAAMGLTVLIAICLIAEGAMRVVLSLLDRFTGWQPVFISGILSVALGIGVWLQWPFSGLWMIGLCTGIELLLNGISWCSLGWSVRSR